jgi:hypothetical protein
MRVVLFCHWLLERGADLQVDEPRNVWSLENPWEDAEHLSAQGMDFFVAKDGAHRVEGLLGFCRELGVETGSLEPVAQERVTA